MNYREFPPRAALGESIQCFWTLEGRSPGSAPAERIVPDGSMELVVNFADPVRRWRKGQAAETQPLVIVVGQMAEPVSISTGPRVDLLGVRFRPAGAAAFLEPPVSALAGTIVDLGAISARFEKELYARAAACPSASQRIAAVEEVLLGRQNRENAADPAVVHSVAALLATRGMVRMAGLESQLGISGRQLERKFLRYVGIGPKRLARIIRFQSVFLAQQRGNPEAWSRVALECGYYDQAHLSRDFQELAGTNPTRLFSEEAALTFHFTHKPARSDFYKTRERYLG